MFNVPSQAFVDNFAKYYTPIIMLIAAVVVIIGSPKLFQELNIVTPESLEGKIVNLQNEGKTAMILGTEKEILAIITVADEVRESGQEIIKKLHNMGVKKTIMLTGDNKETANAIGHHVGVSEIQAELMSEDKLSYIKQIRKDYGNVVTVGDGVNDASCFGSFYCWYRNVWCWDRYSIRNSRCCFNGR